MVVGGASGGSSVDRQASFKAPKGVTPMQGTVRRASCPQLVLDKKKVGHFFFGFSKTKDAKI